MRSWLDRLYGLCGALGAIFLVSIAVLILTQIIARFFDVLVPSANDFAGFSLAASSFLALAYTFRKGGHIRVTLVIQRLPAGWRRGFDLASLAVAAALIATFAWFSVDLAIESWVYNDLSDGLIPVPLWIPQSAMALGIGVLALALVDEFFSVLRGNAPSYENPADPALGAEGD